MRLLYKLSVYRYRSKWYRVQSEGVSVLPVDILFIIIIIYPVGWFVGNGSKSRGCASIASARVETVVGSVPGFN